MTLQERRDFLIAEWGEADAQVDTGPPPPARLSDEELADFHDLLSKMLGYLPEECLSINEVLRHPWLHKTYTDLDPPAGWLSRFDWGHDARQTGQNYDHDGMDPLDRLLAAQGIYGPASEEEGAEGATDEDCEDAENDVNGEVSDQ